MRKILIGMRKILTAMRKILIAVRMLENLLLHLIHQCTTFYNIFMRDRFLCIWFAIQCNTIYIFMFFRQILRNNRESLAIGQMQGHLRQLWSTEYIFRTYRIYRIESHRTKHIPTDICPQSSFPQSPSGLFLY